ncbi:JAB domain-containing protein [Salmonella enterica]|nr:JAB domain-containing protein [Salmonella enterica]
MSELTQHYYFSSADKKLISRAIKTVEKQFMSAENAPCFTSPAHILDYLRLQLWEQDREHFLVLFLNNQHKLMVSETLFSGDICNVEVSPRIIARKCLIHNSPAIVLAHNHPSGNTLPSRADRHVTDRIVQCLNLFNIRVLDHIIISSGNEYWSFAEHHQI